MKTISAGLQTGIDNGTIATCIKVTTKDATVLTFTSHDVTLTVDGLDYDPTPGLQRIVMNLRSNAEVSNQEFTAAWVMDLPEDELAAGKFDNANIDVFKVDWTDTSTGSVPVFNGHIGLVQWSEDGFRADVYSAMHDLGDTLGVQTTAKCRHKLFQAASDTEVGFCGINAAANTQSSTVSTIVTQKLKFTATATGEATDWAANGVLTFTSGNNNGLSFEVKKHTAGATDTFEVFLPTNYIIQAGDTFDVTAGCDKTYATCKSKFNNGINFGGFPNIQAEINYK